MAIASLSQLPRPHRADEPDAMLPVAKKIRELTGVDPRALPDDVLLSTEPLVLRGWSRIGRWCGRAGIGAGGVGLHAQVRSRCHGGRAARPAGYRRPLFLQRRSERLQFPRGEVKLDVMLDEVARHKDAAKPPAIYVGSTTIDTCLPGFRAENDFGFGDRQPLASIWIGNRTRIAAHQDVPDNMACVVGGHRRLTLFPPEQLANLYIGPLDFTPAGQAISLVDFAQPDFATLSEFAEALRHAQVAELGPGDACSFPACGGTTSKRSTASMCWSTTGGGSPRLAWTRR